MDHLVDNLMDQVCKRIATMHKDEIHPAAFKFGLEEINRVENPYAREKLIPLLIIAFQAGMLYSEAELHGGL